MAHIIISFRFKDDETYSARYKSFVEKVYQLGGGSASVWEETSSFFAINANGTAEDIRDQLYLFTEFDSGKDQMVVIDVGRKQKAIKGPVKYTETLSACLGF